MTLHHPHGQIYAYPYVTPRTQAAARRRSTRYGPTCSQRILDFERGGRAGRARAASTGPRSCRSPRAGRSRCTCCPTGTCPTSPRPATRSATSSPRLYLRLLRGIDALYDTPTPYIAAWHQAPVHERRDEIRLHAAADSPAPRGRQAQVPRRLGGGDGRLDRRRHAREPQAERAARRRSGRQRHERGRGDRRPATTSPSASSARARRASGRRPAGST